MTERVQVRDDVPLAGYGIDAIDRRIILATQEGLPLVEEPFALLGRQLGVDSAEVLERVAALQAAGIIRRIAAVPNHYKLGYRENGMTVWNVRDECVRECGCRIGALEFVSHSYRRPRHPPLWPYNLFAMVHGRTRREVTAKVAIIAELLGEECRGHEVLYSTRILKKTGIRIRN
jgi:DNA-binding Lrp family transcriptional regulator